MDTGTLVDRIYRTLREQILQGKYEPGQKLNLDPVGAKILRSVIRRSVRRRRGWNG